MWFRIPWGPSESGLSAFLVVVVDVVVDCLDGLAWGEVGGRAGLFLEAASEAPDRRVVPAAGLRLMDCRTPSSASLSR